MKLEVKFHAFLFSALYEVAYFTFRLLYPLTGSLAELDWTWGIRTKSFPRWESILRSLLWSVTVK